MSGGSGSIDFKKAKENPSLVFSVPEDVVTAKGLTRAQKIAILRSWEYDVREAEVASEENMPGSAKITLDRVLAALHSVNADEAEGDGAPTKQGGL